MDDKLCKTLWYSRMRIIITGRNLKEYVSNLWVTVWYFLHWWLSWSCFQNMTEDNLQAAPNYPSYIRKIYIFKYWLRETKDDLVPFSFSRPSIFSWYFGFLDSAHEKQTCLLYLRDIKYNPCAKSSTDVFQMLSSTKRSTISFISSFSKILPRILKDLLIPSFVSVDGWLDYFW